MIAGYKHVISLDDLLLQANIGVTDEERDIEQDIKVSYKFFFKDMPKACDSDDLADTVCYDQIAKIAVSHCKDEKVKLLEYLVFGLYKKLRKIIPADVKIWVKIEKCNPPIDGMQGGVSFEYSDI